LPEQIAAKVRAIFRAGNRLFMIFSSKAGMNNAMLSAADDEGAILISSIRPERNYLALQQARILHQLAES